MLFLTLHEDDMSWKTYHSSGDRCYHVILIQLELNLSNDDFWSKQHSWRTYCMKASHAEASVIQSRLNSSKEYPCIQLRKMLCPVYSVLLITVPISATLSLQPVFRIPLPSLSRFCQFLHSHPLNLSLFIFSPMSCFFPISVIFLQNLNLFL